MWSKIIWKGILPNAAAQDPKERVQLNSIHTQYKPVDHYIKVIRTKKKSKQTVRLTDLEWPRSLTKKPKYA